MVSALLMIGRLMMGQPISLELQSDPSIPREILYCFSYLPPATKLRQGNIFTPVCQSFRSRSHPLGQTPPQADTPLCSACWDMVNKRAVCILLELFKSTFYSNPTCNKFTSATNCNNLYFKICC